MIGYITPFTDNISQNGFMTKTSRQDDLLGGNYFRKRVIHGPAVRGRAGGCTETATAYNSGFTRRSLRSLGAVAQPARWSRRLQRSRDATACARLAGS